MLRAGQERKFRQRFAGGENYGGSDLLTGLMRQAQKERPGDQAKGHMEMSPTLPPSSCTVVLKDLRSNDILQNPANNSTGNGNRKVI